MKSLERVYFHCKNSHTLVNGKLINSLFPKRKFIQYETILKCPKNSVHDHIIQNSRMHFIQILQGVSDSCSYSESIQGSACACSQASSSFSAKRSPQQRLIMWHKSLASISASFDIILEPYLATVTLHCEGRKTSIQFSLGSSTLTKTNCVYYHKLFTCFSLCL